MSHQWQLNKRISFLGDDGPPVSAAGFHIRDARSRLCEIQLNLWCTTAPVSVYKYVYMHFTGMSRVSWMRISDDADIDTFNNASNNNNRNNNY